MNDDVPENEEIIEPLPGDGEPLPEIPEDAVAGEEAAPAAEASEADLTGNLDDPNLSVEDMLADALPMGDLPTFDALAPLETAAGPHFQIRLRIDKENLREPLKKVLEDLAIPLSERDAAQSRPLLSRLTEFQAVKLLNECRALGIEAQPQLMTLAMPGEPDPLDSLPGGTEDTAGILEAGASVRLLPDVPEGVQLVTAEQIPGYVVLELKGIVSSHRSIARRFFREEDGQKRLQAEIQVYRAKPSSPAHLAKSTDRLFHDIFFDLQKSALARGANAVLEIKLQVFSEISHSDDPDLDQLRLIAMGSAAVVEKLSL